MKWSCCPLEYNILALLICIRMLSCWDSHMIVNTVIIKIIAYLTHKSIKYFIPIKTYIIYEQKWICIIARPSSSASLKNHCFSEQFHGLSYCYLFQSIFQIILILFCYLSYLWSMRYFYFSHVYHISHIYDSFICNAWETAICFHFLRFCTDSLMLFLFYLYH